MAKTRKQQRRKHRRGGGGDMTEAQMQALIAREKKLEEDFRPILARVAAATEARTAKLVAENEARRLARVTPTRRQPSRKAKSKSMYYK